jgi:hypothetical protein
MLTKRWERLKTKPAEIDRLKLLARLELTADQAQRALKMDAASVSGNPYLLFEDDRTIQSPTAWLTGDFIPARRCLRRTPCRRQNPLTITSGGCRLGPRRSGGSAATVRARRLG